MKLLQSKMSLLPHFVLLLLLVAAFTTIPSLAEDGHDDHKPPHHDDGHDHHKPPHSEKPPQQHDHELTKKKPPTEEPPQYGLDSHHKPPPKHKGPPHRPGQTQLLEVAEELAGQMPRKVKPSFPVPSKEFSPTEKKKHHGHGHHD